MIRLSIRESERLRGIVDKGRRSSLIQRSIIVESMVCKVGISSIALRRGVLSFVAYN